MRLLQKFFLPLQSVKTVGWLPEWPNGADCKSAGYAFGGSNPSAPTANSTDSLCAIFLSSFYDFLIIKAYKNNEKSNYFY